MATQQIALMFLLIAANCQRSQAAALAANENAPYFSELCRMIQLATTKLPTLQDIPDTADFEAVAELVNLSYTAHDALKQIANTKTAVINIDTADTPANKYCKDGKTTTCKKLAALLGEQDKKPHAKIIFRALSSQSKKTQVEQTAAAIITLLQEVKKSDAADKLKSAQTDINEALEGKPNGAADATVLKSGGDRATTCGKPGGGGTKGAKAGTSLALDTLCVCGKDGTQTTATACGFDVTTSGAGDITWASGTNAAAQWENAKAYCKDGEQTNKLSPDAIRAAVAGFTNKLATGQLASNYFPGGVGTIDSSPTNGCTGEKTNSAGCCIFYGKPSNTIDGAAIPWVQKLLSASSNLDAAEQKRQSDLHIFSQIQALNVTLTALIIAPETTHNAETPGGGVSTESQKTKPMEEKKKECEQHENNKTACTDANCKWQGKADADGPYEVDESKVKEQTNTAAGTGEGATGEAAATTGCARHGTNKEACLADKKDDKQNCAFRKGKECEDDEGTEMCRNGSFLVNKKLAPIVSAFVNFRKL
uniref:Variant surface glycoprotein 1125.4044 n=1 Tax=Trypanosoma brucei TaxID=5691 RepID=A0A1J0R9R4_9TRYP|nr:variant surface glycoprotein 1125.4044 [Trypanosoma brucei]